MKYKEIEKKVAEIPTRHNWVSEVEQMDIDDVLQAPLKSVPHIKKILKNTTLSVKFYADRDNGIAYIRRVA